MLIQEITDKLITIQKFWVDLNTGKIIDMEGEDEHDQYEGFEVPPDPFRHHWVRGGFSDTDDQYYLEAGDKKDLRRALELLNRDWSDEFKGVAYDFFTDEDSDAMTASGHLTWEEAMLFMKTGKL